MPFDTFLALMPKRLAIHARKVNASFRHSDLFMAQHFGRSWQNIFVDLAKLT
jgi:hypothetical protein